MYFCEISNLRQNFIKTRTWQTFLFMAKVVNVEDRILAAMLDPPREKPVTFFTGPDDCGQVTPTLRFSIKQLFTMAKVVKCTSWKAQTEMQRIVSISLRNVFNQNWLIDSSRTYNVRIFTASFPWNDYMWLCFTAVSTLTIVTGVIVLKQYYKEY